MHYLGIDVGSSTCKLVIINEYKEIVFKKILSIMGEPLKAVNKAIIDDFDKFKEVSKIGVTGSSRSLIAKHLKTNIIKSEVIAHTLAAIEVYGNVGTIFEIGGQDAKFISLENSIIKEFKINSTCAAGTGAFLEAQARKMGLTLNEFDIYSQNATNDIRLTGKCAVFIESAIINYQKLGESIENIVKAICYALAKNYYSEFCKGKTLTEPIYFQGGVAKINALKSALEKFTNKEIFVHPLCEFMGALGMAIFALEARDQDENNCIMHITLENAYKTNIIFCNGCKQACSLVEYLNSKNELEFIIGGRCGKYS